MKMSREIKFRAWDNDANKMRTEDCFNIRYGKAWTWDEWGTPRPTSWEIMQYTGLKDRRGQEIYDGDVIKMIAFHNDHHQKGAVDYASIYFSHGQFCIALDGHKIGTPLFHVKLSSSVEVIGNIHENPELF